jgi:hypothetical protein
MLGKLNIRQHHCINIVPATDNAFNASLILHQSYKPHTHKCGGAGAWEWCKSDVACREDAVCVTPLDFYAGAREGLISIVCVCYCLFLCEREWGPLLSLSLT